MAINAVIYGWRKCPFGTDDKGAFSHSVRRVWFSPDKTKAVLEIWASELYVAVRIKKEEGDVLACEYVDHFIQLGLAWDFKHCRGVDWSFLRYGFCKLKSVSLDTGESYVHRFYFEKGNHD